MNKTKITESFNPERYGMTFCPSCRGSGRSLADTQEANVCKVCGGFGLIKREKREDKNSFQFGRSDSSVAKVI